LEIQSVCMGVRMMIVIVGHDCKLNLCVQWF